MHPLPRHAVSVDTRSDVGRGRLPERGRGGPSASRAPVPLQKEGATVKISEHVYVIPDFKVGMVPTSASSSAPGDAGGRSRYGD